MQSFKHDAARPEVQNPGAAKLGTRSGTSRLYKLRAPMIITAAALLVGAGAFSSACSASNGGGGGGFDVSGGTGGKASSNGANTASANPTNVGGSSAASFSNGSGGGTGSSMGIGGGCAGTSQKATLKPLDMYVMLDQSGSMSDPDGTGETKWAAVTKALGSFVQAPAADGIGIGLGYFGVAPGAAMCPAHCSASNPCGGACGKCFFGFCTKGGAGGTDSCNAADYAVPAVEIATLDGTAMGQAAAITNSMKGHGPLTGTPTAPAVQGMIDHAADWKTQHPDHVVIAVLATDGIPSECSPMDIPSIAAIAAAGFGGTPSVETFVIGVGNETQALNTLAMGGGSGQAFIVNTSGNANQQFLMALNSIRGAALGCEYQIPVPMNGMQINYNEVNVQYTPGNGGAGGLIPHVNGVADCPANADGWYYDNPTAPTEIEMCPFTCMNLSMDSQGQVDIVLGCQTVVN